MIKNNKTLEALDNLYASGMGITKEELCQFINEHGSTIRAALLVSNVLNARNTLIELADQFQNDFLTLDRFSEYHGLTLEQGVELIQLAQAVRASKHPEE